MLRTLMAMYPEAAGPSTRPVDVPDRRAYGRGECIGSCFGYCCRVENDAPAAGDTDARPAARAMMQSRRRVANTHAGPRAI